MELMNYQSGFDSDLMNYQSGFDSHSMNNRMNNCQCYNSGFGDYSYSFHIHYYGFGPGLCLGLGSLYFEGLANPPYPYLDPGPDPAPNSGIAGGRRRNDVLVV